MSYHGGTMTSVLRARAMVMLGVSAGEVVAVVQAALLGGLPYTGLRNAIFTHPTMAEGLNVLLAGGPAAGAR